MSREVVVGLKNLIARRFPELDLLSIAWFGGEPLLAYDIVIDVMKFAQSLKESRPSGILTSGMTTNGYYLDFERLRDLTSLGVLDYQITLDGEREYHNKVKVLYGGKPTFDRIWKNLMSAKHSDLQFFFNIRVHVSKDNIESVRLLIDQMSELAFDERFYLSIVPLSRFGGSNDSKLPVLDGSDRRWESVPDTIKVLRNYARSKSLNIMPRVSEVCYASKLNAYVIRSNGKVSKCTVALYDKRNIVGHLEADGTLWLDKKICLWWARGLFTSNENELACPMGASQTFNDFKSIVSSKSC
jgi:uncharacterized protein